MNINKVFVAGAGLMGAGIAYIVSAKAQKGVFMYDISQDFLDKGMKSINKVCQKAMEKGMIKQEEYTQIIERIIPTLDINKAEEADLVIEAIPENLNLKKEFFAQLDKICPSFTILASNTSSLPITSIASATKRPDKVIGMHFFSPVHMMKLIELIKGLDTSEQTFETVKEFSILLGKEISTSNDFPGFITTRLGLVLLNEAMFALMEGVGTAEDIDKSMKLGFNHPMGPLELADAIGLDICLSVLYVLYDGYQDPKYRACPLLKQLVTAGHLGKKTGRGFYKYK